MTSPTLTVNLAAIKANYQSLTSAHAKKNCGAVVKANAYGLGVERVSKALFQAGCREFFVATLFEGIELRGILPDVPIAVFNGIFPGEEKEFAAYRLTPVLNSLEQATRFKGEAILHVDTGMTRLGLTETDLKKLNPDALNLRYVMSHLACAGKAENPKNAEQLARFKAALKYFPGVKASFANSAGLFMSPEFHFDLGRPGCALYGIHSCHGSNSLQHVAALSAPILQLRETDRDETVGYGASFIAKKGTRLAIIALGYADGVSRSLSNLGSAYVGGVKVPFAGRVSMDMIALDVSALPANLLLDSRVEFINEKQTVNDVADASHTIGYEIFTRIGRRVKREYIG